MKLEDLFIPEEMPAIDAMRRLDEVGRRILFVAPGGILRGVLTDSDTRRFILRGGDLTRPVREVANYSPKSLPLAQKARAQDFMKQNYIDAVPLVNAEGRVCEVVFQGDFDAGEHRPNLDMPVVVMAGGLGTRLYPYTKILPKPLIPIGEVPIIELVLQKFGGFGCHRSTLIVNYRKNMIKSYFADLEQPYDITWVDEEEPLGTGGGLCLLKGRMDETFFLTNCDCLIDADYADLAAFHKKQGNTITMVCATKRYTIPYGVVELDDGGDLAAIREKPQMNFLTNTGMYVVEAALLNGIEDGKKQGFPDIMAACRKDGGKVGVYPIGEACWMDMGQMEELDEMRRRFEQNG